MALSADVLVPGNYFCDLVFTGFPAFPALGTEVYTQGLTVTVGGVLNTVVALQRLGVNVGWVGALGSDFFSRYVEEVLQTEGVTLDGVQRLPAPLQRVTAAVSYPHDRAFITYVDDTPNAVDLLLGALEAGADFRHVHFSRLMTDERLPALMRAWRDAGKTLSMDCQHRQETLALPIVREVLSLLDWFMPNASEAMRVTNTLSLEEAVAVLRPHVRGLLVKDGGNGAHVWHENGAHHAPALALTPVDTTGAGDVFNAGFLKAWRDGLPLPECLRYGNVCGGLSTQGYGGAVNAPTLSQVLAYL
jgi:sugar/nucleoside kinase (ribokinase family)